MKKILLALALTMVFVFTACSAGTTETDDATTDDSTTTDSNAADDTSAIDTSDDASYDSFTEVPFKLISGTPPIPDPLLVYEGNVKLSGWIIYKPAYVGEDVAHFRVADEDLDKLPEEVKAKRTEFVLVVTDENGQVSQVQQFIVDEITAASEAGPATIIVDRLNWGAEGSPSLNFVELVE